MGRRTYSAQTFINAIPGTGGIISAIARRVGCNWHTAKRYIEEYPTVRQAYDDEVEALIDMAESILIKSIQEGDPQDAKWFLARKGKHRGYQTGTEVGFPDGAPVVTFRVVYEGNVPAPPDQVAVEEGEEDDG